MPDPQQGQQKKLTRQELYQRIRETSKDEYILEEMIRLGFWPEHQDKPTVAEELIKRRAELMAELRQLGIQQSLYQDPEKALAELHKQRKKQALERREETRRKRNQERYDRKKAWFDKNQRSITYLGEGSAPELTDGASKTERLDKHGLPHLESPARLADAMGIKLHELRFLSYYRDVARLDHYQHFQLVKKSGGSRRIAAPMPRLKRAQYWILANLLEPVPVSDTAHGFIRERSIVSNASPHSGQAIVINMDLKDFFPTITRNRVKGLFHQLGYSEQVAAIIANLCTAPARDIVELDGQTYYVAAGERSLPQGAPTSPAISNLICRNLDKRISGAIADLGFVYTRYADDLTFSLSTNDGADEKIKKLFWRVKSIINDEGFTVHPDKTRVMRAHQRQEVTGIVVNEKPSISRKTLKNFRALLFQIDKDGPEGKRWGNGELFASIEGFANYVAMVTPEKGIPLQKQVAHLKRKNGFNVKHGRVLALNKRLMRIKAAAGEDPRDNWWQPALPAPPVLEKTPQQIATEKQAAKSANGNADQAGHNPHTQAGNGDPARKGSMPATQSDELSIKIARAMIFMSVLILILLLLKL
ncbi:MAG: reverse transcriptase family protein [Ketobacteraceae bacterium]|nr:reverse transcriptase family protein [Ketobacteraceae bacterium]